MAEQKIKASEIINKIDKGEHIYYENTLIEGDLNFADLKDTAQTFKGSRSYINSHIAFINCTFKGKVIAYDMCGENEFECSVATTFLRNVLFIGCKFEQTVYFSLAIFSGYTYFEKSHFSEFAHFHKVQFIARAYFGETVFKENALFREAVFNGGDRFKLAKFEKGAAFNEALYFGHPFDPS
ncbi:MAG: pentapeptide repeat-containing protein [Spirochaetes bacterium]|nr:pentapeptide repeat-containing protein [Spirochaetota bacterium]